MNISSLSNLDFPRYPHSELSNTSVRHAYAKANAYITLALNESNIPHDRSQKAAAVTDATHNLPENLTAEEYLNHAQMELATAYSESKEKEFKESLELIRQKISQITQ